MDACLPAITESLALVLEALTAAEWDFSKAKAALTEARIAANVMWVPPAQRATIDLQTGILYAEEKDYNTAFCNFYDAFDVFNAVEDSIALFSLKYMLLCKVMLNKDDIAAQILSSKAGLKYMGPHLATMKAIADAYSKRSLNLFETSLKIFEAQLEEDPIVRRHLSSLYDTIIGAEPLQIA